jgi:omega-amidase
MQYSLEKIRDLEPSMITIALAQMDVSIGQPEANLARAQKFAAQAHEAGADLLLLPELWLHGYDLERAEQRAAPLGEGGFAHMAALAREFGLYLAGSTLERHADGGSGELGRTVSNTAAFYAPDGKLLGSYRKIHLFRMMQEPRYLTPGDHATLCPTPWGPVGLAICYDLRFPEPLRALALAGAVLILVPAQWPTPRIEAWLILAHARAIENELFIAACNRVGRSPVGATASCGGPRRRTAATAGDDGETDFSGHSCVVDPWGHALVEGDDQERLLVAQVDLREVRKARRYLTVYEDRRPDAYHVEPATATNRER